MPQIIVCSYFYSRIDSNLICIDCRRPWNMVWPFKILLPTCASLQPDMQRNADIRLAAPAERRGGFETFGWAMWAAGTTRNSSRLAVPRATTSWASNSKSLPAAFSTRRLTRKPPGTMRQLVHSMLSPGGPGYDRGRLTSVPGPGAGNHDSPNALYCHTPPALPEAGETTCRAGRGYPTARTPGSG
jgi:hypothetical protein